MVHEVALRGRKCFASRGMLRSSKRCSFGFCYLVQFAERSLGPESRPTNSVEKSCRPLRSEPPLIGRWPSDRITTCRAAPLRGQHHLAPRQLISRMVECCNSSLFTRNACRQCWTYSSDSRICETTFVFPVGVSLLNYSSLTLRQSPPTNNKDCRKTIS